MDSTEDNFTVAGDQDPRKRRATELEAEAKGGGSAGSGNGGSGGGPAAKQAKIASTVQQLPPAQEKSGSTANVCARIYRVLKQVHPDTGISK